jgi:hypothetical protein
VLGGASGLGSVPCILNSGRLRRGDGCALIDAVTRAVRSDGGRAICGVIKGVILSEGLIGRRLRREMGLVVDDVELDMVIMSNDIKVVFLLSSIQGAKTWQARYLACFEGA